MTDAPKVHEDNKAKAEAETKVKADKAEVEVAFRVNEGTKEVKDKDGNVTTQGVPGDSKQVVDLKGAYKLIALSLVDQLADSRARFFALDTLRQSLNWAAEASQTPVR